VGYFTNYGPKGPLKYRDVPGAMGVVQARDGDTSIGQAFCLTWDGDGNAVF
jgi:hypothetical protein